MTVHKRCCYYLKQEEVCKGHPVSYVGSGVTLVSRGQYMR